MRAFLTAGAVAWILWASSASALTIKNDYGGEVFSYIAEWKHVAASGENVIIDGECDSACTMILGIVPHDRMCITKRAKFGFHQAFYIRPKHGRWVYDRPSHLGTMIVESFYPDRVRAWIKSHGGLTRKIKYMPGKESGLKACQ